MGHPVLKRFIYVYPKLHDSLRYAEFTQPFWPYLWILAKSNNASDKLQMGRIWGVILQAALFSRRTAMAKKFVLGCVISPLAAGAISRNLGQAFLPISVCGLSKLVRYKMKCASSQKFFENLAVTEKMSCFWGLNLHPPWGSFSSFVPSPHCVIINTGISAGILERRAFPSLSR